MAERSKAIDCKSIELCSTLVRTQPSLFLRVISSVGRAFRLHRNSRWFESVIAHTLIQMFFWIFLLTITYICQISFFISYTNSLKNKITPKILFFILIYLLENTIILLFIHFSQGRNFVFLLLKNLQKNTILKDPQDFLYMLFNTGWILLLIYFFLTALFLTNIFWVNIFRRFELNIYYYTLTLLLTMFFGGLLIFFTDLITTHWEIFYQDKTFDFQPDLIRWYLYYKGELLDFFIQLIFLSLIFMFLLMIIGTPNKISFLLNRKLYLYFRLFLTISLWIFTMSFFGGESLLRDVLLLIFSVICTEITLFTLFFFKSIKRFV